MDIVKKVQLGQYVWIRFDKERCQFVLTAMYGNGNQSAIFLGKEETTNLVKYLTNVTAETSRG